MNQNNILFSNPQPIKSTFVNNQQMNQNNSLFANNKEKNEANNIQTSNNGVFKAP